MPQERQCERGLERSRVDEGESRAVPPQGQKRAHDELSKRVEDLHRELHEVRRNIGQAPRQIRGVPFAKNVMVDDLPASFSLITFEYDGTSDPCDHVCRFENTALLLGWGKMPSVRYYADQVRTYLVQLVR